MHLGYGLHEAAADFVLVALVAINCVVGWRQGLVRRAIAFAAVFGGVAAASYTGNSIATVFKTGDLLVNAWTFLGVFALVVVLVEILTALYADRLAKLIVIAFDRVAGLIAGAVVGILEVAVIFMVALAVGQVQPTANNGVPGNHADAATAIQNGVLSQLIAKIEPGIQTLLAPALPGSLPGHLAEGIDRGPGR